MNGMEWKIPGGSRGLFCVVEDDAVVFGEPDEVVFQEGGDFPHYVLLRDTQSGSYVGNRARTTFEHFEDVLVGWVQGMVVGMSDQEVCNDLGIWSQLSGNVLEALQGRYFET